MSNLFGRPSTPAAVRGTIPFAVAYGVGRAAYGIVQGNQQKQRNKGYIARAYRAASARLDTSQRDIRDSSEESLNERGLANGGMSAVRAAMVDGQAVPGAPTTGTKPVQLFGSTINVPTPSVNRAAPPTTLAGQAETNLGKEFALERDDLNAANTQANRENKADYLSTIGSSIESGVQGAASAYSLGKDLSALRAGSTAAPSAAPSAVRSAYATGIDDPANVWGGIHPVDPLGAPGSSWNSGNTIIGDGQANYGFNRGNG